MIFCREKLLPGEYRAIPIPVPGGEAVEAHVFCGAAPGRTLVLTAGVHGCEYVGIQTLRRLVRELDPAVMSGNVVLVPLANSGGFYAGLKQFVPEDGVNLNRAFPGSAEKSLAYRIAFALEQALYPVADFLADLHGGDGNQELMPLVFFPTAGESHVNQTALEAAKCLTVPYRVRSTAVDGLYSWAVQKGVPAMLIERGGAGRWSEEEVAACREDVYSLLRHMKILPGDIPARSQTEIVEAVYEDASCNGFWLPFTRANAPVRKGELLGCLETCGGQTLAEVRARFDGVVMYHTFALGVRAGDSLVAYGR
ncbi:MAG: M14 family metallopeptidase [Eubacteriales bacterium]|nr:M14 family metallopeptidase [Eubacteriales bacterium]